MRSGASSTRASGAGRRRTGSLLGDNKLLIDACDAWAYSSLQTSRGARMLYGQQRAGGASHHAALRTLANRLVGILHGCLRHRVLYNEETAWAHRANIAA